MSDTEVALSVGDELGAEVNACLRGPTRQALVDYSLLNDFLVQRECSLWLTPILLQDGTPCLYLATTYSQTLVAFLRNTEQNIGAIFILLTFLRSSQIQLRHLAVVCLDILLDNGIKTFSSSTVLFSCPSFDLITDTIQREAHAQNASWVLLLLLKYNPPPFITFKVYSCLAKLAGKLEPST